MALTKQEREERIKINKLLDHYSGEIKSIFDDTQRVNEAVSGKISTLSELQKLMDENKDRLAFLGKRKFSSESRGGIVVSLLMMSTKKVNVPDDDNLISLGYEFRESRDGGIESVIIRNSNERYIKLEDFMEFPVKPENSENALSASDIVKKCDSSFLYKTYQEDAVSLIRKLFPYPYGMFTGPNLYKREEKIGPKGKNTLYVTYDKFRKKFKYAYNPDFILESAVEEWMLNRSSYKSLKDCYCYLLAFMITHEMLHIIHHNTDSVNIVNDSRLSTSDHWVSNCVMDSFINCKISRRFIGAPQLNSSSELAPIIQNGIGSKISVRIEHNKGLKKFNSEKDLSDTILKVIKRDLRLSDSVRDSYYNDISGRDLSKYEGADIFISIDISPKLNLVRSQGSNLFQTCFNDIIMCITDGKAHDLYSPISDSEKVDDLDRLPIGSMVLVKGSDKKVGIITGFHEETNKYDINSMKAVGTKLLRREQAGDLYVTEYEDSGNFLGTLSRIKIRPYDPESDAFYANAPEKRQDKLSQEDIDSLNRPKGELPPPPPGMDGGKLPPKSLKVGDIVWVRKLKKFGRITSVDKNSGKFTLEEVIEKPCKVIDDSDNYI